MERNFIYLISSADNHLSVGQFLKQRGFSHPSIVALKKIPESILCNGAWVYVTHRLCTGDTLTIHLAALVPDI